LLADKSRREAADWCLGFFDSVLPAPYLAVLCSRDLRTGFARLAEYKVLFGPKQMSLEPCRGGLSVVCDWQADDAPGSLYFVDLCVLRHLAMRGTGRTVTPLRAEIPGAANVPDALARELLGVPVEAGPVMRLTFAEADLGAKFNTSNPATLRMLEDGLQQRLFTVSDRWSERLKFTLKRLLPDQRKQMEDAAAGRLRQLAGGFAANGRLTPAGARAPGWLAVGEQGVRQGGLGFEIGDFRKGRRR
jgi:hypothetical protein